MKKHSVIILGAYIVEETAPSFAKLSPSLQAEKICAALKPHFGDVKKRLIKVSSKSWRREPYVKGCYALFGHDQFSRFHKVLKEPFGSIHFAGEHTAEFEFRGYMEGAVRSGERAAKEVLRSLRT